MSDDIELDVEDLKSEAASLGIKHNANISAVKLKEKIDDYYKSQETSGPALAKLVEKVVDSEEKTDASGSVNGISKAKAKRMSREKDARKTRIITIIDNDQRQNNQTTTCTVNCSNQFFDLGTRILPLGEKIEVAQGHIDVLKEVFIPIHNRDPKSGLSVTKTRPRYSISYEN